MSAKEYYLGTGGGEWCSKHTGDPHFFTVVKFSAAHDSWVKDKTKSPPKFGGDNVYDMKMNTYLLK